MARAFSLRIFLPDGDASGLKVVSKSQWTGRGLVIPRALLSKALQTRMELQNSAGVYFLVGESDDPEHPSPRVYVGEADPPAERLPVHDRDAERDFWTHAVVFTSSERALNKAHVQYLESRLAERARSYKRCVTTNKTRPTPPTISEAETAEAEIYLENMLQCLPPLGYFFFDAPSRKPGSPQLFLAGKGVKATGYQCAEGLVVSVGSQAINDTGQVGSISDGASRARAELVDLEVLRAEGGHYVFTQDYVFNSPSLAAGVILGASSNGWDRWKDAQGRSLNELAGAAP